MKTFRWTVPELPLTKREKHPRRYASSNGMLQLVCGVWAILHGISYMSPGEFINGLQTYFWKSAQAVVTEADVPVLIEDGNGTVTYEVAIGDETVSSSTYLDPDKPYKKREAWAAQYVPGNEVTVYYRSKDRITLGHWPVADVAKRNLAGIGWFWLCFKEFSRSPSHGKLTHESSPLQQQL